MSQKGSADVARLSTADLAAGIDAFDVVIDVRSPAEFALDHIPGSINCPVLDNEERILIGTLYKQESPFAAKKRGAALVAKNIAQHLETHFLEMPREWRPLIYCWRGGERSGAFTHILRRIGWKASQLEGGYQGFRRQVIADLAQAAEAFSFRVICGMTGSGKTRVLHELAAVGEQVLDLECLANHRGSVLGGDPIDPQPTQKAFETRIWNALRQLDPSRAVFVESESKKVGGVHIPDALMERIRLGECIEVRASNSTRVSWLMREYHHFLSNTADLEDKLGMLRARYGNEAISVWCEQAQAGRFAELVEDLLVKHYDPSYQGSIRRNFLRYDSADSFMLDGDSDAAFLTIAKAIKAKYSS
ncbi:MAG: tRNA 2-selenouridine(34) synthase MnmH [Polynucleobacter sp.]|nr:tRNA 2-selenouridine(34) synthase MnmH [Polynucleobacter sp.]MDZ4056004.1 tRNA 2-selenouridine(34) synthase MnmH [Polynucleobacter sp.]